MPSQNYSLSNLLELRRSERVVRLFWTALLGFLVLLSVSLTVLIFSDLLRTRAFIANSDGSTIHVTDFSNCYTAGQMSRSADRYRVYDPQVQLAWMNKLIAPARLADPFYNQMIPSYFAFMAPLTVFSPEVAYVLWCAFSVSFAVALMVLFLRRFTAWSKPQIALFCLLCVWSLPSAICLRLGQTVWVVCGFFFLYAWALFSKKDVIAGIALGLAMFKPQLVPALAMSAVGLGRGKTILAAIATQSLLLLIAGFVIGFDNVINYPHIVAHAETTAAGVAPERMTSFRAILTMAFGPATAIPLSALLWAVSLVISAALWYDGRNRSEAAQRWLLAITVLLSLLFTMHSHPFDLVLLALPACVTAMPSQPAATTIWARAWRVILYSYPILGYVLINIAGGNRIPLIATNLVLLLLAVVQYFRYVRQPRSNAS